MENIFIPQRFNKAISLHIVKNLLKKVDVRPALILGIHGPSGEGKTFQCEHALKEMNVRSFLISGGQLESHQAGEPAQLVRETYINASKCLEDREAIAAVVLINDIDTGLGSWGDMVQYTINRQTVFGELMHIVDYPTMVEGRVTKRIPIIFTGNDFTKLYEPLVRAGRMTAFEWIPTRSEKAQSISNIFPEISSSNCENLVSQLDSFVCKQLQNETLTLPLAFYSHLKASMIDELLWKNISEVGTAKILEYVSRGIEPKFAMAFSFDDLLAKGQDIIKSGQLINHLGRN